MRLRRLGWAGVELESECHRIVIDMLLDPGLFAGFMGDAPDELVEPEPELAGALLTHLHRDHADVSALDRLLAEDAGIWRPTWVPLTPLDEIAVSESEAALSALERPVSEAAVGDVIEIGPFTATAVDAVDGLGSPQVSWVVSDGRHTVFHGGDTLWHGRWWHIAAAHAPFDMAFLPANGVLLEYPQFQPPVTVPAAMTPTEAVEAARVLQARSLAPIHFNETFSKAPYYVPRTEVATELEQLAAARNQKLDLLTPGVWVDL